MEMSDFVSGITSTAYNRTGRQIVESCWKFYIEIWKLFCQDRCRTPVTFSS